MASCSKTTMPSSEDVDVRPLYCLRCGAAWQLCKWALFSTFYDPSCWRAPPALVRRTATLLASVTTDTFTIFHYFFLCFSFKQREWTNHVWNQMVKICEVGMTRLLTYRQCCKFSRHGCWIKLPPAMGATLHSKWDCGASPTVSAKDKTNSNMLDGANKGWCLLYGVPWKHPICLVTKKECNM